MASGAEATRRVASPEQWALAQAFYQKALNNESCEPKETVEKGTTVLKGFTCDKAPPIYINSFGVWSIRAIPGLKPALEALYEMGCKTAEEQGEKEIAMSVVRLSGKSAEEFPSAFLKNETGRSAIYRNPNQETAEALVSF